MRIDWSKVSSPPAQSITRSAPLPPVASITAVTGSAARLLTMTSAPSWRPTASRESRVPVRITRVAPSARTSWIAMSPMGPGPSTATVSPAK